MLALTRRGFSLVELLIALVLLGIVSGAVYQVLTNNQRVYLAQTQTIDLQQNLRAAGTILPAEFRELDARDSDIVAMSATSITIRAMRKLGFICVAPNLPAGLGNISMVIRATPMYGRNLPIALNDSVLVFYEGSATSRDDDTWLRAQVKTWGPGVCPDPSGNNPGYLIQLAPQWLNAGQNTAGAISQGSPIRVFSTITYQLYQSSSDGQWYLGYLRLYPTSGSIQPLIGPLTGSNGVEFDYMDSTATATTDRTKVALIEIHMRAQTAAPIRSGGASGVIANKVDSITTRVALRNNPRCGPCN